MKARRFSALVYGLPVIFASLLARAEDDPSKVVAAPEIPAPAVARPSDGATLPRTTPGPTFQLYNVGFTGTVPNGAPKLPSGFRLEIYGAFLPFLEYVSTAGATPSGLAGGASQVQGSLYTGINAPARFRMTAGTSAIGFRGRLELLPQLQVIWQVENAVPIDGEGPNTFASRNSHVGFSGSWGSLIWGNWDTPWKWATLVTVNPIEGSFVPDYLAILSTPGFGVSAVNTTSLLQGGVTNAAFYRREANSVQYWSPILAGFSARLSATLNESRPSPADVPGPPPNPWLVSGYLGFDGGGLRIRYAYELHHDYFGMYNLGELMSDAPTASNDQGHQLTVQYVLRITPELRTRIVGTGELLSYRTNDTVVDAFDRYSRPAFYVLLEQTVFGHRVWAAYGEAFSGTCHRVGGNPCSTMGLGARDVSAGYLYAFTPTAQVYLAGYRVINDASSMHSPFPPLNSQAPGSDITGVGAGIFYSFGLGIGH